MFVGVLFVIEGMNYDLLRCLHLNAKSHCSFLFLGSFMLLCQRGTVTQVLVLDILIDQTHIQIL